jgi:non-heme chloroperoxidase
LTPARTKRVRSAAPPRDSRNFQNPGKDLVGICGALSPSEHDQTGPQSEPNGRINHLMIANKANLTGAQRGGVHANGCSGARDEFVKLGRGLRLHVRDWGEGKPIVFVHGWPFCNEIFEYQFTELPQRGFRCIAPSLRGFGRSSQPWGDYSLDLFADDLRGVLEVRCLQDVVLAGHSMGGAIVLRYMARHAGYRVSKLIFFGAATPVWTKRADFPEGGLEQAAVGEMLALCYSDRAQLVAAMGKIFCRTESCLGADSARWFFGLAMQASPHAAALGLRLLGEADLREDLASIRVPTLVMHGVHDKFVPFQIGQVLARGIVGSRFVPFDNSGNALFWEERAKFNSEVARFVG